MRHSTRSTTAFLAGNLLALLPLMAAASDDPQDKAPAKVAPSEAKAATSPATADNSEQKADKKVAEINLLDAMRDGLVTVKAEGNGDGRMTL